jgi:hypothetical protein
MLSCPVAVTFQYSARDRPYAALIPAEGPEEQKAQNHVIFLQNFSDEVRWRMAAGGK